MKLSESDWLIIEEILNQVFEALEKGEPLFDDEPTYYLTEDICYSMQESDYLQLKRILKK